MRVILCKRARGARRQRQRQGAFRRERSRVGVVCGRARARFLARRPVRSTAPAYSCPLRARARLPLSAFTRAREHLCIAEHFRVAIAICEQRAAMASSATCEHEHEHALCAVRARITLPLLVFRFIFAPAPRVYTRSAVHSILVGVRTMSAGCSLFMFSI